MLLVFYFFCLDQLFKFYKERKDVKFGKESDWLTQWLDRFVEDVGMEKASRVLESYLV